MSTIVTRAGKGSALTHNEVDANFTNLNTDKVEKTGTDPVVISVNSASDALRITQTGAGNALVVEDITNPDSSPFVVDTSGNVLIGVTSANANGGILQLSKGITFPATQVAATDANTLDDYEEGTFTPTIVGTTVAGTGTYSYQVGRYTKIGNRVYFNISLDWSAHTGSGNVQVNGLPFTSNATTNAFNTVVAYNSNYAMTANNIMQAFVSTNTTSVTIRQVPVGGGSVAVIALDTAAAILLAGHYEV